MIFLGDIAIPQGFEARVDKLPDGFFTQSVIANLEGAIVKNNTISTKESKLFSGENVIDFLKKLNVKVVSLGNNHITDVQDSFENTIRLLEENDIKYCGAGHTLSEANRPAILKEGGITYAFLSFGWDVIGCKYVGENNLGVNPLEKDNLIKCIQNTKKLYPHAQIIILPHWDYELELYPQPMHRELAKLAIDVGADAVVGHHTHCAQGIELYMGKPIIYGLGNWFIPDSIYFEGKLKYPQISKEQIAIEWGASGIICHRFLYDGDKQELNYIESKRLEECSFIEGLTPFKDMNEKEYINWFQQNRRKKKGLPIYIDYNNKLENNIKNIWVLLRQNIISLLLKSKLKKGPN